MNDDGFDQAEYLMLLSSLKDQLERHVKFDAYEAVVACRQIENSLQALTGKKQRKPSIFCHISQMFSPSSDFLRLV